MFQKELFELETISKGVGNLPEYVQGGGGNTSVKLNDELMAVKASGFKLNQITSKEGYVVINYKNIKNYYENVDISSHTDFEKESVEFAKNNVVEMEGFKILRPSVEAGFHSIMKKYVVHTHPVYANMLCCSFKGKDIVEEIFRDMKYKCIWIPYINPGFCLTLKIKEGIEKCITDTGVFPEVIFMENHGLVVTTDDYMYALALHDEVNDLIKNYLEIKTLFPEIKLENIGEAHYRSNTRYILDSFSRGKIDNDYIDKVALYPDQLVYLNKNISINGAKNKLNVNTTTKEIIYDASYAEALTIEETLLGYLYVINNIEEAGLPLKTMSAKEIDFINNWESEAYRKSLVKDLTK
ncbi:MAG: class II aldolase [Firmicutes bacterium HGW-Firmicutes-7]|nr:MAG: class II aldolase [Firmicutes bacterium HGW-Firmicutes-7]